jgi:serine/threonine protein kinase
MAEIDNLNPEEHAQLNAFSEEASAALDMPKAKSDIPFVAESQPCKYLRKKMIGKGAYGEAWTVIRTSDQKNFVAKIVDLKNTPEKRRRYATTEIRCLANCDHPNVIKYVEDGTGDGDQLIIIMELADAGDLGTQLKNHKVRFSEREAGILFAQLVLALHHIHSRRMIHRDIKSGNVLLSSSGLIKVGDFGFSQLYEQTVSSNSVAGTFLGTPYYLAPEMWNGHRYGKKADVWAAGIVLYEILGHKRPFQGQSITDLKATVLACNIDPIPNISRDMDELMRMALTPDPRKRLGTTQLLAVPIMQHYLTLFLSIVMRDAKIAPELKESIMGAIQQAETDVKNNNNFDDEDPEARFESSVLKDTDGVWKERFFVLQPPDLVMTLAHGKEAAPGTDRSKRIPLRHVTSVLSLQQKDQPNRYQFAVHLVNGTAIVLAVPKVETRDMWLTKLLAALEMN